MADANSQLGNDRNMLFGMLALQMDFVRAEQLIEAMQAWTLAKTKPLGQIFVERNLLGVERRAKVDQLVEERVGMREPFPIPETRADEELTLASTVSLPRYRILRDHAAGGLGKVFVAKDIELNREVALKRIKEEHADNPSNRSRFLFEGEITGQLEHPGIVPVYGLGTYSDGRPYYAMRFIRGQTLRQTIATFHAADQPGRDPAERALALRELLNRFLSVCNAVAYAHSRGVLHRDLKPQNVMLGPFGETLVVDWGLAKLLDLSARSTPPSESVVVHPASAEDRTPTRMGASLGTPAYMAPEQAEGRHDLVDERTDVYLLGGILFESLSGQPPHPGGVRQPGVPSARAVKESVPPALDTIVQKALAPDRAERYAGATNLAGAVQQWLADEPIAAYRAQVERMRGLVEERPDVADLREQLARDRVTLGLVLSGTERHRESEESFRTAVAEYEALVARHSAVSRYRAELATTRVHLSRALLALKRNAEADQAQQQAITDFDRLMATNPRDYRTNLASIMLTLAPNVDRRPPPEVPPELQTGIPEPVGAAEHPSGVAAEPGMSTVPGDEAQAGLPGEGQQRVETRGRFTILSQLAQGGASSIWLARDNDLNREVVIKDASRFSDPRSARMFVQEAQVTAQLEHPNIIPFYGLGYHSSDEVPFLIMRHVQGKDLSAAVAEYHGQRATTCPVVHHGLRDLLRAVMLAARALQYAHFRGVIHCDPKPSNIVLGPAGEVYVIDWGLVRVFPNIQEGVGVVVDAPHEWEPGERFGTPAFMSPEQAAGRPQEITPRTDVYILGATLFHVLTGRPPRQGTPVLETMLQILNEEPPRARVVDPKVPEPLDAICARAMARQPEDRYPSAAVFAVDLERWLAGQPVSVYRESRLRRFVRRLWAGTAK
jgi:serine/threonine protein kinase